MPTGGEVRSIADAFWHRVGHTQPFPRDLEGAFMLALPVTVYKISDLNVTRIERWFRQQGIAYQLPCQNRRLRGCLVAYRGYGFIFADSDDPVAEIRLTLAHEAAHFFVDYLRPRETALTRLGVTIQGVLDGERPPTRTEQVHAVLANVPLDVYYYLMERENHGQIGLSTIWNAENRADAVALELLAPLEAVLQHALLDQPRYEQRRQELVTVLARTFGLPGDMAEFYAPLLLRRCNKGPSFWEGLGLPAR